MKERHWPHISVVTLQGLGSCSCLCDVPTIAGGWKGTMQMHIVLNMPCCWHQCNTLGTPTHIHASKDHQVPLQKKNSISWSWSHGHGYSDYGSWNVSKFYQISPTKQINLLCLFLSFSPVWYDNCSNSSHSTTLAIFSYPSTPKISSSAQEAAFIFFHNNQTTHKPPGSPTIMLWLHKTNNFNYYLLQHCPWWDMSLKFKEQKIFHIRLQKNILFSDRRHQRGQEDEVVANNTKGATFGAKLVPLSALPFWKLKLHALQISPIRKTPRATDGRQKL